MESPNTSTFNPVQRNEEDDDKRIYIKQFTLEAAFAVKIICSDMCRMCSLVSCLRLVATKSEKSLGKCDYVYFTSDRRIAR